MIYLIDGRLFLLSQFTSEQLDSGLPILLVVGFEIELSDKKRNYLFITADDKPHKLVIVVEKMQRDCHTHTYHNRK